MSHAARGAYVVEQKRSFGRMLVLSVLVLAIEAALAAVVSIVIARTQESPSSGYNSLWIVMLPLLAGFGAVLAAVLSAAVVLPSIWLSDALGRWFGRPAWWWVPLAVGAVTFVLVATAGLAGWGSWPHAVELGLVATALLIAPALVARCRRQRLVLRVAWWGVLLVAGVPALGFVAFATGLLEEYRPPAVTAAMLAGAWRDGEGGTLTLTPDGVASASRARGCTGQGSWKLGSATNSGNQEVGIVVGDCSGASWYVGGTKARITLYQYIGDPDAGNLYVFRKDPGGPES